MLFEEIEEIIAKSLRKVAGVNKPADTKSCFEEIKNNVSEERVELLKFIGKRMCRDALFEEIKDELAIANEKAIDEYNKSVEEEAKERVKKAFKLASIVLEMIQEKIDADEEERKPFLDEIDIIKEKLADGKEAKSSNEMSALQAALERRSKEVNDIDKRIEKLKKRLEWIKEVKNDVKAILGESIIEL